MDDYTLRGDNVLQINTSGLPGSRIQGQNKRLHVALYHVLGGLLPVENLDTGARERRCMGQAALTPPRTDAVAHSNT